MAIGDIAFLAVDRIIPRSLVKQAARDILWRLNVYRGPKKPEYKTE